MNNLGEWLAWRLNRLFPMLAVHKEITQAKESPQTNQAWSYQEAISVASLFAPHWDLKNKLVLDIGTGSGGKEPFYVECGARAVVGIDISTPDVILAREHMERSGFIQLDRAKVWLAATDASVMPFPDNTFDAVVSINVFEHIMKLEPAIQETYRILKPGGRVFLFLPPYYSPWGPHLEHWIHYPWAHLLFSDRTLMRVAAREDAITHVNERFVQTAQIDWQASQDQVPGVNKVTLQRFHRLVKQAGFTIVQRKLLPIGYLRQKTTSSQVEKAILRLIGLGAHLPLIQEVIVTKMAYVLGK